MFGQIGDSDGGEVLILSAVWPNVPAWKPTGLIK